MPLFGQRTVDLKQEKAIPAIDAIDTEIDALPTEDVRESLAAEKLDAPEEFKNRMGGKIAASRGLKLGKVRHWSDDATPFAVEFEGKGTVALDLPKKLAKTEEGEKTKLKVGKDVFFVTATVQPALSSDPNELSYLFVSGAVIGFGLEPPTRGIRAGNIFLLNGDARKAKLGDWFPAGISFPVDENYQASMPLSLTLRIDPKEGEWDLYLMNRLRFAGVKYGKAKKDVSFRSAGSGLTKLSELAVWEENPFFDDADSDGIEDKEEEELGFSSEKNDRYELDELDEFTNLQHFMNLRKVYRPRSAKELEETLLAAAAAADLGQEPAEELKEREIPDQVRTRRFTEEQWRDESVEAAKKLKKFGRKPDDRSEAPPILPEDGKEGEQ